MNNKEEFNNCNANGNHVTLKEFIMDKLDTNDRMVKILATSMEKRLDSMNEFRDQLKDQAATLVPRAEWLLGQEVLSKEIKSLSTFRDQMEGKASQFQAYIGIAFGLLALVIGIMQMLVRK